MIDLDAYEAALGQQIQNADERGYIGTVTGLKDALSLVRKMREMALYDPADPSLPVMHAAPTTQAMRAKALPRSGTLRLEIVTLISGVPIRWAPGHTDSELEGLTGRAHQSVSAARNGLVRDGWLTAATWGNGTPITRRTASGNPAQVWRLTGAARRALGLGGFG